MYIYRKSCGLSDMAKTKNRQAVRIASLIRVLLDQGGQSMPELQKKLGVSDDTVHRDLEALLSRNLIAERGEVRTFSDRTAMKVFYWQPELPAWKREIKAMVDEAWHKDGNLLLENVENKVKGIMPKDQKDVWYPFLLQYAREAAVKVVPRTSPPLTYGLKKRQKREKMDEEISK